MKAKGNDIQVALSLTIRPEWLLQGRCLPRNTVLVSVLLPFAFCLPPS
jgi:hypothetical protein